MANHPLSCTRSLALTTLVGLVLGACTTATSPPGTSSASNASMAAASAAPAPVAATPVRAADETLRARVEAEFPSYLETLKTLAGMESGSRDLEGLAQLAAHLATGSPGSSAFITQLGSECDAVLSFEGGGSAATAGSDMVRLATSSIAIVEMKITGKASHAGLRPKGGVLESFGLRGFGAHSNDNEYVLVFNLVPRLYLATRMVMDVGRGEVKW